MIKIKNLTKGYKRGNITVPVLNNINLYIKNNAFTALLGRSGSGKTTLMNIIGCLDKADSGEYYLDSHDIQNSSVNQLAQIRNKYIGFVFQQFHLLPQLTALENTALPLFYQGIATDIRLNKAKDILASLDLESRVHHKPNELSGGQQQRVAIARALITDPKIILADEPTGNLDSKSGRYIMELFNNLHTQGKTIILITHDQHIADMADEQISLIDGEIKGRPPVAPTVNTMKNRIN